MRSSIRNIAKGIAGRMVNVMASQQILNEKTSPSTKIALKGLYMDYQSMVERGGNCLRYGRQDSGFSHNLMKMASLFFC